jgi:hypothetical protein
MKLQSKNKCLDLLGNTSQDFPVGQEKSDSLTNIHSCKWIGCSLFAPTLAQLMVHICEQHFVIGNVFFFTTVFKKKKKKKKKASQHYIVLTFTYRPPMFVNGRIVFAIKNHF